jgi:hypothetical protein
MNDQNAPNAAELAMLWGFRLSQFRQMEQRKQVRLHARKYTLGR